MRACRRARWLQPAMADISLVPWDTRDATAHAYVLPMHVPYAYLQASLLADPAEAAAEAAAAAAAAAMQRRGLPSQGAQDEERALMELIPGA